MGTPRKAPIVVGNFDRPPKANTLPTVTVGGITSHVITYNGRPVVTTRQLAHFLGCSEKHLADNHANNRARFEEEKHLVKLTGEALRQFRAGQPENFGSPISPLARVVTLWTERGAARHSKMLGTEQAWSIFEELEDNYFRRQQTPAPAQPAKTPYAVGHHDTLSLEQANTLRETLEAGAKALPKDERGAFLREGWSRLKAHFGCHYRDIPAHEFDEAVSLLTRHVVRHEVAPAQQPVVFGHVAPDARAALVVASNALAQVVPVLVALAGQEAANDPSHPRQRRRVE